MNSELIEARKNCKDGYHSAIISLLWFFVLYFVQALFSILFSVIPDPNAIQVFIGLSIAIYVIQIIPIIAAFKNLAYANAWKEDYEIMLISRILDLEKQKEIPTKTNKDNLIEKTKGKTTKINIDLSESITKQIKDMAKSTNKSETDIIEEILNDSLDFKSKK